MRSAYKNLRDQHPVLIVRVADTHDVAAVPQPRARDEQLLVDLHGERTPEHSPHGANTSAQPGRRKRTRRWGYGSCAEPSFKLRVCGDMG